MAKKNKAEGFESCIIDTWEEWDQDGTGYYTFYNAVLSRDVGSFKVGDELDTVFFNLETCQIVLKQGEKEEIRQFAICIAD